MFTLPLNAIVAVIELSDWRTLAAWRATSRTFFRHVALHLRRRYHNHIAPFIRDTDTHQFDDLLRDHGAIISGSVALHFFLPDDEWNPRELDIYVPSNTYHHFLSIVTDADSFAWARIPGFRQKKHASSLYPSVFRFIGGGVEETEYTEDQYLRAEDAANYVRQHSPCPCGRAHNHTLTGENGPASIAETEHGSQHDADSELETCSDDAEGDGDFFPADDGDVTDAFVQLEFYTPELPSLVHGKGFSTMRSFRTPTQYRVNVVASYSVNPVTPLRYLWSTIMQNFITPDGCVCGVPSATLCRRGASRVDPLTIREQATLAEYERRQFVFDRTLLNRLDLWDYLFFGEQKLLATSFYTTPSYDKLPLPLSHTARGWIADDTWRPAARRQTPRDDNT